MWDGKQSRAPNLNGVEMKILEIPVVNFHA